MEMDDYKCFLKIIRANLARKYKDKEKRRRIFERIAAKYRNSEIFSQLEFEDEDVEDEQLADKVLARDNCFGDKNGFPELNGVPREKRVEMLRKCYGHCKPVFSKSEMIPIVDERGKYGRTMFHDAVIAGDCKQIQRLYEAGADPDIRDNNGHTPFMLARLRVMKEVIEVFLKLGIEE
jgi:hypothetical protein